MARIFDLITAPHQSCNIALSVFLTYFMVFLIRGDTMPWVYLGDSKDAFCNATPASQVTTNAHQQQTATSCWVNTTKHIINYYRSVGADGTTFREDSELEPHLNKIGSAPLLLKRLGYASNTDGNRIPTVEEIHAQMQLKRPLLINVGPAAAPTKKANPSAPDGHWMVIIGCNAAKKKIALFDPDSGEILETNWNWRTPPAKYSNNNWFWQNTSYVDNLSIAAANSTAPIVAASAPSNPAPTGGTGPIRSLRSSTRAARSTPYGR